jgi:uncharacterized iron-regulated membrane protein
MAATVGSAKVRLRQAWFQVHKWIGLLLAILIVPICLTGSALVWHDWVDGALNPQRSAEAAPAQAPGFYAEAARRALRPGETLLSLTYPEGAGAVLATAAIERQAAGGRPVRTLLYLHPEDGRVLDRAASNEGAVRVMHVLHGSLMVPGVGRKIVGWIGVAMLVSSLTGLWLWWPFKGGFARGLRWKRMPTTSGNLHHQGGFWIALPLAVLSFTGAWISFPAFFGPLGGDPAGPPRAEMVRRMGAAPLAATALAPEQALAAATPFATGALRSIAWPTAPERTWTVTFHREGGPAEVKVADGDGTAAAPAPPRPETTARLMRRIHDGTDMGVVWQVIVFLGGLIPAALAVTGVMMWLRGRKVRGSVRAAFAEQQEPASPQG